MNFAILIFVSNLIWRNINDKVDVGERCNYVMVCMQDEFTSPTATELNGPLKKFFNSTIDVSTYEGQDTSGSDVATTDTSQIGTHQHRHAATITTTGSMNDVSVFGVKSDKGTGDAFMALPLTVESTEFFVASWG